jgi:hypothetical protein
MKRILLTVLTITLMLNLVGCMKASNSKNEEKTGIRGLITKVLMDDNKIVSAIMVEGKAESDTIHDKAKVGIEKGTKITKDNAGQKLSASELKEGMKVEIVFEGPVMESYPVQGKAKSIKVIGNEITTVGDKNPLNDNKIDLINKDGKTVGERIKVPEGFERVEVSEGSFGEYLRDLPLKPHGSKVKYFNGGTKSRDVYEAVIDIDIGDRDLQQCADSVMRLRAEYLYGRSLFDNIHFNFTNGFKADYPTWRQGGRIKVEGNKAYWVKQIGPSTDYASFRKYLDVVFAYAGRLSSNCSRSKRGGAPNRSGTTCKVSASPRNGMRAPSCQTMGGAWRARQLCNLPTTQSARSCNMLCSQRSDARRGMLTVSPRSSMRRPMLRRLPLRFRV